MKFCTSFLHRHYSWRKLTLVILWHHLDKNGSSLRVWNPEAFCTQGWSSPSKGSCSSCLERLQSAGSSFLQSQRLEFRLEPNCNGPSKRPSTDLHSCRARETRAYGGPLQELTCCCTGEARRANCIAGRRSSAPSSVTRSSVLTRISRHSRSLAALSV